MKNVKRGELYYAQLPINVGSEQSGKRPVVVIQNDKGNTYSPTTIVALITSQFKKYMPTHVKISNKALPYDSIVMTEQLRTIDKSRLNGYIGNLTEDEISQTNLALKISIGLDKRDKNEIQ